VQANAFTASGDMVTQRTTHTATVLPSGAVLAVGGFNSGAGVLVNAELYDPSAGTWAATGDLNNERENHTATLLNNGLVLVTSGDNFGGAVSTAELYDPATGLWTNTGSLAAARSWATATLLADGQVLVAGGVDFVSGTLSSAEIFDPATGTWTTTGPMTAGRFQHRAVMLATGKVLVVGGFSNSAEIYDPATGVWTATGSTNGGDRSKSTLSLLPSGQVLATGGGGGDTTAELYDPATGEWTATCAMADSRATHTATVLNNGKVMVAGGMGMDDEENVLASAELYDPATGTWVTISPMNVIRTHHTATLLNNGQVLIAGGDYGPGDIYYASTELFTAGETTVPDTWTATGSLNSNRSQHTATLLNNGMVLVAGGLNFGGTPLASAELYDTATGTWTSTGALHSPHSGHTATLLNDGKVLIVGGKADNNSGVSITVAEIYDPGTGDWTITGPLTTPAKATPPPCCLAARCWWPAAWVSPIPANSEVRNYTIQEAALGLPPLH